MGIPYDELERIRQSLIESSEAGEPSEAGEAVSRQHIGLSNIHQRLRLIYGLPYGISIASSAGEGTVVSLDFVVL